MPRHIIRNYRKRAEAMNYRVWGDLPAPASRFESACIPAMEDSAHRTLALYLNERRARLVRSINAVISMPALFWNHGYFAELPGGGIALSSSEAVAAIRKEMARENRRKGHRSHRPERLVTLSEALVFARYFQRFGQRVWAREAA